MIQQIQKASFGNSKEITTLSAATLPGLSLLLWCCREEGGLTNGVTEHAAPPESGQGAPVFTSPAGLLKAKVSFSAVVTSQPCHPEPLFPSGKIFQILSGCSGRHRQASESCRLRAHPPTSACGGNASLPPLFPWVLVFRITGSCAWAPSP